jgi:hypothetical protein
VDGELEYGVLFVMYEYWGMVLFMIYSMLVGIYVCVCMYGVWIRD